MRRLMWFALGYASACGVGAYLLRGRGLLLVGAVALVLMAVAFSLRKSPVFRRLTAVMLGLCLGCAVFFAYDRYVSTPAALLDGQILPTEVRITGYSWAGKFGTVADGTIRLDGRSCDVRIYMDGFVDLEPGHIVTSEVKFRTTDVGGLKDATFHRAEGIRLLLYQRGEYALLLDKITWMDRAAMWRKHLTETVEACFPEDTFAFAKALLLGDTTDLGYEQQTVFSVTGISHVVAVSGLHVSILCGVVYLVLGRKRFRTPFVGIPLLLFFAAMVGFTPSVTRAVLMQMLMLLALMADREYDPPTALSFAVVVMLTWCPMVITSVGFQLSVGSVAGIFLFYHPIYEWLQIRFPGKGKGLKGRLERWFNSSVAVTLSATAVTTPLVALYFQTVSLISPLTNLLVLFAVSGIFYGAALVCILSLWRVALAKAVAWAVSWPIRYVLGVAGWLSEFPLAAIYTDSVYVVLWLAFLYGLLLWLLMTRKKRPGLVAMLGSLSLCITLLLSWVEPLTCDYRVTVLDVGQGQCILLQSEGYTFLVDCGGDRDEDAADRAARTLLSQGISQIDGLILTHYDRDHAGGVAYLASRIQIERLYLPETEDSDGLLGQIRTIDAERIPIDSELEITFGEARILLYPAKNAISGNDSSASVLFQRGKCDTLITGDLSAGAELQLLEEYGFPDLEVLVVGHHGSRHSTCDELLQATAPDVAIISVGANNSYGHPTEEVLERLKRAGCAVFRTDRHGTITYRG